MRTFPRSLVWRIATLALVANIASCAVTDPNMTGAPSYNLAGAVPPTLSGATNDLGIGTWQWLSTESATSGNVQAAAPERYTLTFEGGGRVLVRADCNRGSGAYQVSGSSLKIMPIALTRMGCPPGSQDSVFAQALDRVTGYAITGAELTLRLADGGTMRLRGVR